MWLLFFFFNCTIASQMSCFTTSRHYVFVIIANNHCRYISLVSFILFPPPPPLRRFGLCLCVFVILFRNFSLRFVFLCSSLYTHRSSASKHIYSIKHTYVVIQFNGSIIYISFHTHFAASSIASTLQNYKRH